MRKYNRKLGARNPKVRRLGQPESWVPVLQALLGEQESFTPWALAPPPPPAPPSCAAGNHTMSSLKSFPPLPFYDSVLVTETALA